MSATTPSPRRTLYIGTGWKMNKTVCEARDYVGQLLSLMGPMPAADRVRVFLVPPFTAIDAVKKLVGDRIWVGAQNMHWAKDGAYTGEISAPMLKELGIDLVELGHSERRAYFNETDAAIHLKVLSALEFGIRPLVCVGESGEERDAGVGAEAVTRQICITFGGLTPADSSRVLVAYEPYWSIGTAGTPATPEYVRGIRDSIDRALARCFGADAAQSIPVLYGGSVNLQNAADMLARGGVDGLFVGRTAWQPDGLAALVGQAHRHLDHDPVIS